MKEEALKLALEALERYQVKRQDFDRFADEITAIKQALALDKKAENARELGLDYEPAPTSADYAMGYAEGFNDGCKPAPAPGYCKQCKQYSIEEPLPAAQPTWIGLTDEEIEQGCKESWVTEQAFQSAVWWAEARLKEKNT